MMIPLIDNYKCHNTVSYHKRPYASVIDIDRRDLPKPDGLSADLMHVNRVLSMVLIDYA